MTPFTQALSMIGAHVVDLHTTRVGEMAFENAYGRARAAGLDPEAAFEEAKEVRRRAVIASSVKPRPANDDDPFPPDSHLNAVIDAALNEKEPA